MEISVLYFKLCQRQSWFYFRKYLFYFKILMLYNFILACSTSPLSVITILIPIMVTKEEDIMLLRW